MVVTRSSTSSSSGSRRSDYWRRGLAAGFLALAILLGFDTLIATSAGRSVMETRVESGQADSVLRLEKRLARLVDATGAGTQVAVLGNSRSIGAIDPAGLTGVRVSVIARAGMEAFQQRVLAEGVASARPEVVILTWSEFDTHRPVRLEPVVGRALANTAALRDLLGETDADFAWRNRDTLLRASLAALSNTYRYREVLGEAFGFAWRRFPGAPHLSAPAAPPMAGRARIALFDAQPRPVSDALRREIGRLLLDGISARPQTDMVSEIRRGQHVEVQEALLRRTVQRLHTAGIAIILVEAPLHPISQRLYDPALREDFEGFAQRLVEDFDVHFVPLDSMRKFRKNDFLDLMHVSLAGRAELTRAADVALREVLASF